MFNGGMAIKHESERTDATKIARSTLSDTLHAIKSAEGIANNAKLIFTFNGDVYDPVTGDLLGNMVTG